MEQVQGSVAVRLTSAEGLSILVLAQNRSLPLGAAGGSAVNKLRDALVRTAFEVDVIEIWCTEDEAKFLERSRNS